VTEREQNAIQALPAKVRAFVAIRVSTEVEASLADFVERLRSPRDGIAWSSRDKLHITLKFLGAAVDSAKLAPLAAALAQIASETAPMEVRTRGVGGFPDLIRPRVLWVGLECAALGTLAARVEQAAAAGFDPSDRPWAPHLTIGRVRDPRRSKAALRMLRDAPDRDFGASGIEEMTLYRSQLLPEGSVHEKLASFRFSDPSPAFGRG
jgi:2'-5' RNA ligase